MKNCLNKSTFYFNISCKLVNNINRITVKWMKTLHLFYKLAQNPQFIKIRAHISSSQHMTANTLPAKREPGVCQTCSPGPVAACRDLRASACPDRTCRVDFLRSAHCAVSSQPVPQCGAVVKVEDCSACLYVPGTHPLSGLGLHYSSVLPTVTSTLDITTSRKRWLLSRLSRSWYLEGSVRKVVWNILYCPLYFYAYSKRIFSKLTILSWFCLPELLYLKGYLKERW